VSLLPARHILVILDACHSGIALGALIKWRDAVSWEAEPAAVLQARRSRRIITSALDDEVAVDSGPMPAHSLFTGCLIEGLTGGIRGDERRVTTGSALGLYLQQRVGTYPHARQTPDFGTFALDERGEMVIPLIARASPALRADEDTEAPAMAADIVTEKATPSPSVPAMVSGPAAGRPVPATVSDDATPATADVITAAPPISPTVVTPATADVITAAPPISPTAVTASEASAGEAQGLPAVVLPRRGDGSNGDAIVRWLR
jgi:hypothetical protein